MQVAGRGRGTGWHFEPPTKPTPVAGVDGFVEGSLSAFFLKNYYMYINIYSNFSS